MSTLSKFLVGLISIVFVVGLVSTGLATIVTYKPFGVTDFERARYEERVAEIRRHKQIRHSSDTHAVPQVVVPTTRYDFGLLNPHETQSHAFEIRNNGNAPLALNVTETTCKCTVGEVDSGLLLPGEKTLVTLTWNTGQQEDHYQQKALVTTNDPTRASIELTVEGTVRTKLHVPDQCQFEKGDPGEKVKATFVVHSQLHKELAVLSVQSELDGFDWSAEPLSPSDSTELAGHDARGATRITIQCTRFESGSFSSKVSLQLLLDGQSEPIDAEILASGRTHKAISFHSPKLHSRDGLDIGTLQNNREHVFPILVRQRVRGESDLEVLDFEPKVLEPQIERINDDGDYRLTIRIPENSPMTVFNLDQQHGYIEVGDPTSEAISNWFPILGAVVPTNE